ncbi:flagellar hook-basal body complex protein FliE [Anaerobacillus isosaccharinicus]|uniref:Flagellar hook-basal body complex protein FliE n=1 Tax=Anaerobacillus isosaccharinicus TaxID=1532552 RepID=A0A1S2L6U8_9BACI|nr:flagellar hook-basal body complex protein FliE [Anaerobacillus isosaccharinicus]MBA5587341.1 flagellar hook-basal body complex protein FliE [Anaerobacillus isosaccharinicus]QOY34465.1 flagellar hook-basal body complex protein FliE [Anaerobacillus isosaccharinicus]
MEPVSFRPNSVMNINGGTQPVKKLTSAEAQNSFKVALSDALHKVNDAQHASSRATEKLARGESIDLHQVMITAQKASISLQATIEVRNKVVEAYQEVMRMQV